MTITVPTKHTNEMRQRLSTGDKSYNRLVIGPAKRFFWLTMIAYVAGANAALLGLADVLEWFDIVAAPFTVLIRLFLGVTLIAVCVAALEGRRYGKALHEQYLKTPDITESTSTEERAVVNDDGPRMQMTAPPPDSPRNFQVGKFGFTKSQLASLAVNVANGGSFSHNAFVKAGIITDRTNPDQASTANEIQADFVRLGYAYTQGRATVPSTAGLMYFAQYAPTPHLAALLSKGHTTNHNQPQPDDDEEAGE